MNVVVCLKQTLDPEIPLKDFKIDPKTKKPIQGNAKLVIDSYAENALEVAIKIKEKTGSKVTVITVGDKSFDEVLRRGLAFTADEAIRVWDSTLADLDAGAVAHILGQLITGIGGADIVLVGRQAADVERGSVGPMLAEELHSACLTFVTKVEPDASNIKVTREAEGCNEIVESKFPVVMTVTSNECNVPRLPKVKDTMMAMRKPIVVKSPAEINVEAKKLQAGVTISDVYVPKQEGHCEFIPGEDGTELAHNLLKKLHEMKLL